MTIVRKLIFASVLAVGTPTLAADWEKIEEKDGIKIRKAIPLKEALARLSGIIPKSAGKPTMDPLELKKIWEPKL